jgi:hypothetical protein
MERSNEVVIYKDCQRIDVADFNQYLATPGYSHSSIKSDKGGYSAPFNVTKKVMIGKIVDQILTDSGKVDYSNENYPISKKIAAYIQGQFNSILPNLQTQIAYTGTIKYKGLTMPVKGILDYLLPNFCVLDLKVTAEKNVDKLIEFMGYKNQLWHYGRLAGVKFAYILIYSTHKDNQKHPLRMIKIDISSPNNTFWENAVLNFGEVACK